VGLNTGASTLKVCYGEEAASPYKASKGYVVVAFFLGTNNGAFTLKLGTYGCSSSFFGSFLSLVCFELFFLMFLLALFVAFLLLSVILLRLTIK
jgi:hypothetical protein